MRLAFVSLVLTAAFAVMFVPALAQHKLEKPLVDHFVRLDTRRGPIVIKVYFSIVPYTASNFLNLVHNHFYDGLTFHRVEPWVVQGGDPQGTGKGNFVDPDTGKPRFLKLEISSKLNHDKPGMVAMARGPNNINSASCQFYIIKQPVPQLDGKYAVFGYVVDGMDTVNKLQQGDRILSASIADGLMDTGRSVDGNAASAPGNPAGAESPRRPSSGDSGF